MNWKIFCLVFCFAFLSAGVAGQPSANTDKSLIDRGENAFKTASKILSDVINMITPGKKSKDSAPMYNGFKRSCYKWSNDSKPINMFTKWKNGEVKSSSLAAKLESIDGSTFDDVMNIKKNECSARQVLGSTTDISPPQTTKPVDTNSWSKFKNGESWFFVEREHFMNYLGRGGKRHPSSEEMTSGWSINGEEVTTSGVTKVDGDEAVAFQVPNSVSGSYYLNFDYGGLGEARFENRSEVERISKDGKWSFEPIERNNIPPKLVLNTQSVNGSCMETVTVNQEDLTVRGAAYALKDGAAYWFKFENPGSGMEVYSALEVFVDGQKVATVQRSGELQPGESTIVSTSDSSGDIYKGGKIRFQPVYSENKPNNQYGYYGLPGSSVTVNPSNGCGPESGSIHENNVTKTDKTTLRLEESSEVRMFNYTINSGSLTTESAPQKVEFGDEIKFVFNVKDRGVNYADHAQIGKFTDFGQYSWRKIQGEIRKDNGAGTNWTKVYSIDTDKFFRDTWSIEYFQDRPKEDFFGNYVFHTTFGGVTGDIEVDQKFKLVREGEANSETAESAFIPVGEPEAGDYLPTQTFKPGKIPQPEFTEKPEEGENEISGSYREYCGTVYGKKPEKLTEDQIASCLSNNCAGKNKKDRKPKLEGQVFSCKDMMEKYCSSNLLTRYNPDQNKCERANYG